MEAAYYHMGELQAEYFMGKSLSADVVKFLVKD